jgi:hypothetical protein
LNDLVTALPALLRFFYLRGYTATPLAVDAPRTVGCCDRGPSWALDPQQQPAVYRRVRASFFWLETRSTALNVLALTLATDRRQGRALGVGAHLSEMFDPRVRAA